MSNSIFHELEIKRQEQQDFRSMNEKWVLQYEPLFTHALTLTFNHTKVRRQMMKVDASMRLNSSEMIDLYKSNMRTFKWHLVKRLYGNRWNRFEVPFVFIPILEGLGREEKPHYHCVLGVTRDRFEVVSEKICSIWNRMPLGGNRVDIQPYISMGWVRYSTKNALFANRESIDWENVLVPRHKSLAE